MKTYREAYEYFCKKIDNQDVEFSEFMSVLRNEINDAERQGLKIPMNIHARSMVDSYLLAPSSSKSNNILYLIASYRPAHSWSMVLNWKHRGYK